MTVTELKERLEEYEDAGYGDVEIQVAQQPSWPLAGRLRSACRIGKTIWIASGAATEYAPQAAWNDEDIESEAGDCDEE